MLLAIVSVVRAADDWTLTTSDFHTRQVRLSSLDARHATVVAAPSTRPSMIDMRDVLALSRTTPSPAQPARFILQLAGGDRLAGEADLMDADSLHWREALLGPMSVPMARVMAIKREGEQRDRGTNVDVEATSPSQKEDVATLMNGDVLRGAVIDLNGKSISIQPSDDSTSATLTAPMRSLRALRFAATAPPATASSTTALSTGDTAGDTAGGDGFFRVTLVDGSRLSSAELAVDPQTVTLTTPDGARRQMPIEDVQSIDHVDGPVVWLSATPPSQNMQIPLLDHSEPARFDRSVTGGPLRFGDRVFAHGIGVHAYSRLSWPIGPRDRTFRTQFAVAGDAPYADMDVRIKLDGQTVSDTPDFRAGTLSPVVMLDVGHSHMITLEVKDVSNDDVQARLNWIEPALLRFTPSTRP